MNAYYALVWRGLYYKTSGIGIIAPELRKFYPRDAYRINSWKN
jgi:hypothetical protein